MFYIFVCGSYKKKTNVISWTSDVCYFYFIFGNKAWTIEVWYSCGLWSFRGLIARTHNKYKENTLEISF